MPLQDKNIILNQILVDNSLYRFKEIIPFYSFNNKEQSLTRDTKGNIYWSSIDMSLNLIVNKKFLDTNIYYDNERIGIGREPLFTYKIDVAVPQNTIMTAFHIGDGSFGFSMGNGTNNGFLPEIIGIGANENDAGLYLVGIASNDNSSHIPLLILDGRNSYNKKLTKRPILGVTSGDYNNYSLLLDVSDNLNIKGNVITNDILLNNNVSLIKIITELQKQIDYLKGKIE